METKVVQITGRGTNVNLAVDDRTPFDQVMTGLRNHLLDNPFLYSKGRITVNVGRRMLNKGEITQIKELLEKESGVTVTRFWCPPEILEAALSESVGFGVAVSTGEKTTRESTIREDIAHNDPRFTALTRSSAIPGPAGLEQWEAYSLEPPPETNPPATVDLAVEPAKAAAAADPLEAAPEPPDETPPTRAVEPEAGPELEQNKLEASPQVSDEPHDGETQDDETPVEPMSFDENGIEKLIWRDQPGATRIEPKREPTGLNRGNEALLVKTICRSGEVIRYPGDVVVMADVNPGGEIIADGDILVFGNLRGFAHAGASGDTQATIIALNLDTHRLQIGPYTGVDPKPKKRSKSNKNNPRIAYVRRSSVYVAPYAGRFGGYSGGTLYDG